MAILVGIFWASIARANVAGFSRRAAKLECRILQRFVQKCILNATHILMHLQACIEQRMCNRLISRASQQKRSYCLRASQLA
jgi:hypothetical protein